MDVLVINNHRRRRYTVFNFLFDLIMVCLTGGLWFFWILIRETNKR